MIRNFDNKIALDIWENNTSKSLPKDIWMRAKALLTIMHGTSELNDLKVKGQPGLAPKKWTLDYAADNCLSSYCSGVM